jgi:protein-disulfide isomerase
MRALLLPILVFILVLLSASPIIRSQAPATPPTAPAGDECGCDPPLPEVLATVNGTRIIRQDISATEGRIKELKDSVVEARKGELDLQINSLLLQAEAKKRGVSNAQLLETEIVKKLTEPTDAEAQAFFDQNRGRIGPSDFSAVKKEIIEYLRAERQRDQAKLFADQLRASAQVKILGAVTPPANDAQRSRVFATVNGKNITSADIEDSLQALVSSVRSQIFETRKKEVDVAVNDLLLTAEAKRQNVTAHALIESVMSKVPPVTDNDARKFFDENKARINGEFDSLKLHILSYLEEQAKRNAEKAFADELRRGATIQIFLTAPQPPFFQIAVDDQPIRGNANAKVTLMVFSDFECGACAQAHEVLNRLSAEYGDNLRLVMRDYPLEQHANAFRAAEAAEAAREQGKFWEYAAILFHNQKALGIDKLKEYASQLQLDRTKFDAALDSRKFREQVARDIDEGGRLGVNATPTFFVNGRRVSEISYEALKAAIDAAINAAPLKTMARP